MSDDSTAVNVTADPGRPDADVAAGYIDGRYLAHHPTWDVEHAERKAREVFSVIPQPRLRRIFTRSDSRLVEIGCGAGGVVYYFSRILTDLGIRNTPVGWDISPDAIAIAKENFGHTVQYRCQNTPEPAEPTSLILLVDVLEHVPDPGALLRRLKAWTRHFAVRLPLDNNLWNRATGKLPHLTRTLGHIHFFNYREALRLVADQGLRVINYAFTDNFRCSHTRQTKVSRAMLPLRWVTSGISQRLNSMVWGGNSIVLFASCEEGP